MNNEKFWLVWQPDTGLPTVRHLTEESAKREAKRLAGLNPDKPFFVMEGVARFERVSVTEIALVDGEEELPF